MYIKEQEPIPPQFYYVKRVQQLIDLNGEMLDSRSLDILSFRFGLTDEVSHTLEETAQRWNVTRERIRQMERKSLKILGATDHDFYMELQDEVLTELTREVRYMKYFREELTYKISLINRRLTSIEKLLKERKL